MPLHSHLPLGSVCLSPPPECQLRVGWAGMKVLSILFTALARNERSVDGKWMGRLRSWNLNCQAHLCQVVSIAPVLSPKPDGICHCPTEPLVSAPWPGVLGHALRVKTKPSVPWYLFPKGLVWVEISPLGAILLTCWWQPGGLGEDEPGRYEMHWDEWAWQKAVSLHPPGPESQLTSGHGPVIRDVHLTLTLSLATSSISLDRASCRRTWAGGKSSVPMGLGRTVGQWGRREGKSGEEAEAKETCRKVPTC